MTILIHRPSERDQPWVGAVCVFVSALGSSFLGLFTKIAFSYGFSPDVILTWRFLIASLVLGLIAWRSSQFRISRFNMAASFMMGACGYAFSALCFFSALQFLTTGVAAILLYTFPPIVILLTWLLDTKYPSRIQTIAMLAALVGCVLVSGVGNQSLRVDARGLVYGIGAAFFYAIYLVMSRRVLSKTAPLAASFFAMFGAFVVMFFISLKSPPIGMTEWNWGWASIAAIAIVSTVIPVVTMLYGIYFVGPVKASILSTVEPVCTLILGALILSEHLSSLQLMGAAAVLTAVLILTQA